jgi:branched-chain amino acid transport system substrate-binding protein
VKRRSFFVVAASLLIVTAACGDDDDDSSTATTAASETDGTEAAASALPDTIRIGVPLDLSGNPAVAPAGQGQLDGIELAVEEIADSGFLGDTEIELVTVDTLGDTQAAVEAVLGFVQEDVDAVVGFSLTQSFLASGPELQTAEIPTMTAGLAAPGVTEVGDYIFRLFPNLGAIAPQADVEFAEAFEATTAAYLTQSDVATAAGLQPARKAALEAAGVETVEEQTFASTDTDLRAQLTAIQEADPDVIVASIVSGSQTLVYLQAQELGIDAEIIGSAGVTADILSQAGDAMQCAVYLVPWAPQSTEGNNEHFVELWGESNDNAPNVFNAYGYGAMWALATGIEAAGSVDGPAVRDALVGLDSVDTPQGSVNFQENRDAGVLGVDIQVQDSEEVVWDPEVECSR